ncbi:hypothetical protein TELCIR_02642 [Teladorsagia circumcincta]|uniref:Uncharacterized protein n=1 Tax=Teladorsagia circumcincta TaxID=45464 RepID=A0A2G9UYI1_TELCI|nr:hypothetical protein TELCIR_02642 [Teladorsagia circumcincta]
MVIHPLKGMRMKINLGEKALMERRLPTDIMGLFTQHLVVLLHYYSLLFCRD